MHPPLPRWMKGHSGLPEAEALVVSREKQTTQVHSGRSASYLIDPAYEGRDPGEDGRLAVVVAAQTGPEADHAMHFPLAATSLAVQWPSRVSLGKPSGG